MIIIIECIFCHCNPGFNFTCTSCIICFLVTVSWKFTEINFPKRSKIVYLSTGHYKKWKIINRLAPKLAVRMQYVEIPDTLPIHVVFREINGNEIVIVINGGKKSLEDQRVPMRILLKRILEEKSVMCKCVDKPTRRNTSYE